MLYELDNYEKEQREKLKKWKRKVSKKPFIIEKVSKNAQNKINSILPDKYHEIMTVCIKNMTKMVLLGSTYTNTKPIKVMSLKDRDELAYKKIKLYKTTATIEGAGTGAGGILLGIADFPLLLSIKIKLLYELASIYGFDTNDYRERLYILGIFQLAFSSKEHVNYVFESMEEFDEIKDFLPKDMENFDWKNFQQEYRDYIDLAKLLQLVPGIGVVVGAYANNRLLNKLGDYAISCYHMRLLDNGKEKTNKENFFIKLINILKKI